jgi:hypothetical protein
VYRLAEKPSNQALDPLNSSIYPTPSHPLTLSPHPPCARRHATHLIAPQLDTTSLSTSLHRQVPRRCLLLFELLFYADNQRDDIRPGLRTRRHPPKSCIASAWGMLQTSVMGASQYRQFTVLSAYLLMVIPMVSDFKLTLSVPTAIVIGVTESNPLLAAREACTSIPCTARFAASWPSGGLLRNKDLAGSQRQNPAPQNR